MIDYQAHFPDYNRAAPPDPVFPPPSTPAAAAVPNLVAPAAVPAGPVAVEDGPSNDPLVGEAQLRAMMNS
jgi:hypothetical protein